MCDVSYILYNLYVYKLLFISYINTKGLSYSKGYLIPNSEIKQINKQNDKYKTKNRRLY